MPCSIASPRSCRAGAAAAWRSCVRVWGRCRSPSPPACLVLNDATGDRTWGRGDGAFVRPKFTGIAVYARDDRVRCLRSGSFSTGHLEVRHDPSSGAHDRPIHCVCVCRSYRGRRAAPARCSTSTVSRWPSSAPIWRPAHWTTACAMRRRCAGPWPGRCVRSIDRRRSAMRVELNRHNRRRRHRL